MRIDGGFSASVKRAYYCQPCFRFLARRAANDIPGILRMGNDPASKRRRFGVLLGYVNGVSEQRLRELPHGSDMGIDVPIEVLVGRDLLKRYYLTGDELEAFKEQLEARRVKA